MKKQGELYWITGLPGSGKTTIGNSLYYDLLKENDNVIILDGNILKEIVDDDIKYDMESRLKRAYKYSKLAGFLVNQGMIVVCCTVAMFNEIREENRATIDNYVEIYLKADYDIIVERNKDKKEFKEGIDLSSMQDPENPDLILGTGKMSIKECLKKIKDFPRNYRSAFDRDANYWNNFYSNIFSNMEPSLFAQSIQKHLKPKKRILDIGCGNGRDSMFFAKNDLDVTGIDASASAIENLSKAAEGNDALRFVCDDFVTSETIYKERFDYVYSRFTIHAINLKQELQLLKNIYGSLNKGGLLFVEVRSIHDELYGKGERVGNNEYIYNGHFRRFIVLDEFNERLKNAGFEIVSSEEERGFAPFEDADPPVIRVIAKV